MALLELEIPKDYRKACEPKHDVKVSDGAGDTALRWVLKKYMSVMQSIVVGDGPPAQYSLTVSYLDLGIRKDLEKPAYLSKIQVRLRPISLRYVIGNRTVMILLLPYQAKLYIVVLGWCSLLSDNCSCVPEYKSPSQRTLLVP